MRQHLLTQIISFAVCFTGFLFLATTANAATFNATNSGDWNDGNTWDVGPGNIPGVHYPDVGDEAIITGFTVTVTSLQTVDSIFMDGTGAFTTLNINSGITLQVTNGVAFSVNAFGFAFINVIGTGALQCDGNVTLGSNFGSAFCGISMGNTATSMTLGGEFFLSPAGTFSGGTSSSIEFNGTVPQTLPAAAGFTYHDITINNLAGVTLDNALSSSEVTGSITVSNGTLNNGGFTIAGNGSETFEVQNGAIFQLSDAAGAMPTGFGTTNLAENSTVEYNRGGAQSVTGTTYSNLLISGSGTKTLSGGATVTRELVVTSAFATGGNGCTLESTAARSAAIGNSSGSISGSLTIQRHIEALTTVTTFGHWFMIASPLANGQSNIEDWNTEFDMTGFTGTEDPSSSFGSVFYYVEDSAGLKDIGYTLPNNTTDGLVNGRGYFAFIGADSKSGMPKTVNVNGQPLVGSTSITANFNNNAASSEIGWNLMGNPYAAPVTWTNTNRTNISGGSGGIGYVLDNTGDYDLMPSDRTVLASGEAFWVQASAAGSVGFDEDDKASADTDPFHSAMAVPHPDFVNPLRVWLNVGTRETKSTIYLNANATEDYDVAYDAQKLNNVYGLTDIATVAEGRDLALNFLPAQTGSGLEVPIRVYEPWPSGTTDNYTVSFTGVQHYLQSGYCLILEDRETATFTSIDQDSAGYSVTMSDTTSAPRFFLHISQPVETQSVEACFATPSGELVANPVGLGPFDYLWKDGAGNVLRNVTQITGPDTLAGLVPGDYSVEVGNAGNGCGLIQNMLEVTEQAEIVAAFSGPDTVYLSQGGTAQFVNQSTGATDFLWQFGDGGQSTQVHATHTYTQVGQYQVDFTATEEHCAAQDAQVVEVLSNPVTVTELPSASYLRYLSQSNGVVVELGFEQPEVVQWTVIDGLGRTVLPGNQLNGNDLRWPVDLSAQASGVYLLQITVGDERLTRKIIR
ncbi:MAG: PKD domain-containing protein [Salibacteraceae bacterium]